MCKTREVEHFESCVLQLKDLLRRYATNDAFAQYFDRHYLHRKEQWARAFRPIDNYLTIVTSMHVETTFRTLKHRHLHGQANQRLDVLTKALFSMSAEQAYNEGDVSVRKVFTARQSLTMVCCHNPCHCLL